jgi:hypothetical protein
VKRREDAVGREMHKPLLALALLQALCMAAITVHFEVRARLRAYDLARGREALAGMRETRDAVRSRTQSIWAPGLVMRAALSRRDARARLPDPIGEAGPETRSRL